MSLLIGAADQAKVLFEQKVTLQSQKLPGHRPLAVSDDPSDGHLGVIITDPCRHSSKELEGTFVSFEKYFGAFPGKRLHEDRIRIGQRHHKQTDFGQLAPR